MKAEEKDRRRDPPPTLGDKSRASPCCTHIYASPLRIRGRRRRRRPREDDSAAPSEATLSFGLPPGGGLWRGETLGYGMNLAPSVYKFLPFQSDVTGSLIIGGSHFLHSFTFSLSSFCGLLATDSFALFIGHWYNQRPHPRMPQLLFARPPLEVFSQLQDGLASDPTD